MGDRIFKKSESHSHFRKSESAPGVSGKKVRSARKSEEGMAELIGVLAPDAARVCLRLFGRLGVNAKDGANPNEASDPQRSEERERNVR